MDDRELLERYCRAGDHEAFAQLVRRHSDWIYASARRQIGDVHLAEDITQAVFLLLARKASTITSGPNLGPWLFGTLRYCVREARRCRSRQQRRELLAAQMKQTIQSPATEDTWDQISSVLDDSVAQLNAPDRQAILLRFFQHKHLSEVGMAMGTSEEAARKRVDRAVSKLRYQLAHKGIEIQSMSLSAMMLSQATDGATAALVNKLAQVASKNIGHGTASGIAQGATKMMMLAKLKLACATIAGMTCLVGIGTVTLSQISSEPASRPSASQPATQAAADAPTEGEYYVMGNVPRMGVYGLGVYNSVDQDVTVLQALVTAGVDPLSCTTETVEVIRQAGKSTESRTVMSVKELAYGSPDLLLKPNDLVQFNPARNWIEQPANPPKWKNYYITGVDRSGVYEPQGKPVTIGAAIGAAGYRQGKNDTVTLCRHSDLKSAEVRQWKAEDLINGPDRNELVQPGDVIMVGKGSN